VVSDFSAIHHMPDVTVLPARAFLELALRLPAYQGVMRQRVASAAQAEAPAAAASRPGVEMVPATKAALQANPAFAGVFSFG
jgi:hypothetical protein